MGADLGGAFGAVTVGEQQLVFAEVIRDGFPFGAGGLDLAAFHANREKFGDFVEVPVTLFELAHRFFQGGVFLADLFLSHAARPDFPSQQVKHAQKQKRSHRGDDRDHFDRGKHFEFFLFDLVVETLFFLVADLAQQRPELFLYFLVLGGQRCIGLFL